MTDFPGLSALPVYLQLQPCCYVNSFVLKDEGGKEKTQCADSVQFVSYFPGPPPPPPPSVLVVFTQPHLLISASSEQWSLCEWSTSCLSIFFSSLTSLHLHAISFSFLCLFFSFFFFSAELRGLTRVGLYALITVANDAPPLYNTGLRCQINVKMPPCMFHYQGQQRRGAAAPALDVCIMTSFSVCFLWKTQSFNYNFKDSLHCQDTEAHQCPVFPW